MAGPKKTPITQYIQNLHPRMLVTSSTMGTARAHPGRLSMTTQGSKNRIAVDSPIAERWLCELLRRDPGPADARAEDGAHQRVDQSLPPGDHGASFARALIVVRTLGRAF